MAVVVTFSNHVKYQMAIGNINLPGDTLKAILMNTSFAFDKDAHATLADVTASQIAAGRPACACSASSRMCMMSRFDKLSGDSAMRSSSVGSA